MNVRTSLISLALGSAFLTAFSSVSAQSLDPQPAASLSRVVITADGWAQRGDSLVFVGHAAGTGKTRAQVQTELAAWRADPVSHDGYREIGGDTFRHVGTQAVGKSRADVRAELAAWRANPVSHDGYREIGDTFEYVGAGARPADLKLAAGDAAR